MRRAERLRAARPGRTNNYRLEADAGGIGDMVPPDVPDGEVEGVVIGAGVLVLLLAGFGPQAPSANNADSARDSPAADRVKDLIIEFPCEYQTAKI